MVDTPQPLRGLHVVDFSSEIAGPYATRLWVDAGADVIEVESESGDSLRRGSATGAELGDDATLDRLEADAVIGDPLVGL